MKEAGRHTTDLAQALSAWRAGKLRTGAWGTGGERAEVLSRAGFLEVRPVQARAAVINVGAGVPLATVEAFAHEADLSLGPLSPGVRSLTVGEFLEGPYRGFRHVPFGRLEPVPCSLSVMLPEGRIFTSHPAPRHAAGPDLNALFLGGEARLGLIVQATLRLLPRTHTRARTVFSFPDVTAGVRGAGLLLESGAAVESGALAFRGDRFVLALDLAGTPDSLERDMTVLSTWATRAGGRPSGQPVLGGDPSETEREMVWAEAFALVRAGAALSLFRPSLESVVVRGATQGGCTLVSGGAWTEPSVRVLREVALELDSDGALGGVP